MNEQNVLLEVNDVSPDLNYDGLKKVDQIPNSLEDQPMDLFTLPPLYIRSAKSKTNQSNRSTITQGYSNQNSENSVGYLRKNYYNIRSGPVGGPGQYNQNRSQNSGSYNNNGIRGNGLSHYNHNSNSNSKSSYALNRVIFLGLNLG